MNTAPEQRETPSLVRAGCRRQNLRARALLRVVGNRFREGFLGSDVCYYRFSCSLHGCARWPSTVHRYLY